MYLMRKFHRLGKPKLGSCNFAFTGQFLKNKAWLWELMALIISITSLLAIVVTVGIHHGKPPPVYPLGITINAVVAIYSTILKTTMVYCASESISQSKWIWFSRQPRSLADLEVYDQASRGPWGALILLRCVRWRSAHSLHQSTASPLRY